MCQMYFENVSLCHTTRDTTCHYGGSKIRGRPWENSVDTWLRDANPSTVVFACDMITVVDRLSYNVLIHHLNMIKVRK